jgi:membrane-bound serine protease (ClpP class)
VPKTLGVSFLVLFFAIQSHSLFSANRIDIEGPINSVLADIVVQAMDKAEAAKEPFIVLRLNTPGGFDQAMRKIIEKILSSRIPVVVYVGPSGARAASAGFFILLASDLACMAPGTNTGAAHPILAVGGVYPIDEKGSAKTLIEKALNDSVAYLKGIAEKRGRDVELSLKGITESKSFTAEEALKSKLIDVIAQDEDDLMRQLKGKKIKLFSGQEVQLPEDIQPLSSVEMTVRQKILLAVSDPNLALLLGLAGLILLYLEFSNPGMIAPGVIGALSLLLSLIGFSVLPINFVGVLLILLAFGLFIAEIKIQGFGILGIGGMVSLLFGALILVDAPQPELRITLSTALAVVIPFGLILMFLLRLTMKSMAQKVTTGDEAIIGLTGITSTPVYQDGKVLVRGEYWEASSDHLIPEGKTIRVLKVNHLKLFVEEVK